MSFKKGHKLSKGRPRGAYNEYKKYFIEIQKIAAEDARSVYAMLKAAMERGEAFAFQLYFKELFKLPKKYIEDSISIDLKNMKTDNVTDYLHAFTESLADFTDFTKEEICTIIKTLSDKKLAESIRDSTNRNSDNDLIKKMSDEEIASVMRVYTEAEKRIN